jgi:transposase
MKKGSTRRAVVVVGLDQGDRHSQVCGVDAQGERLLERRVATTKAGLASVFAKLPPVRVVLEAGGQARWVAEVLGAMGHEAKVVNPRKMRRIYENENKSDVVDARELAEAGLYRWAKLPVAHLRGREAQEKLAVLRSRDLLVQVRTRMVNLVRSLLKQEGVRIPRCSAEAFPKRAEALVPEGLRVAAGPQLEAIADLTERVKELDRWIEAEAEHDASVQGVRQVKGVGPVTGAAFVWTLEDPERFRKSRVVGSYLGLRPRRDQSGETDKQMPITKAGNSYLRRLLVGCAHYVLGPHGPDTALRQWGLKLAQRGGKRAKRKAVVAVARKLAVLLHHLWVTGEVYEAFPAVKRAAA